MSQPHAIYNKRNNIIKSGHEVLSGIQLENCVRSLFFNIFVFNFIDSSEDIIDNEDDSDIDKTYEPPNQDRNEMS